jgi:hypothetical protein
VWVQFSEKNLRSLRPIATLIMSANLLGAQTLRTQPGAALELQAPDRALVGQGVEQPKQNKKQGDVLRCFPTPMKPRGTYRGVYLL